MSEIDSIYGEQGIDTPYEREKINYQPNLSYSKEHLGQLLRPETKQLIERSRAFTITQNLMEYEELIDEIDELLNELKLRNDYSLIQKLDGFLSGNHLQEISRLEKQMSGYDSNGDVEMYVLLYRMKESIQTRRSFIDEKFRTQFTNETEIESIKKEEQQSIDEWEFLEAKTMEMYQHVEDLHEEDDVHSIMDSSLSTSYEQLSYEDLEKLEIQKRQKELFHTSLADTSYIHRNRYFMFLELIEKARILINYSYTLIDKNLKYFIQGLAGMPSLEAPKAHLLLQFRKIQDQHSSIKGKILTIDDEKETFASEKHYLYQQLETKTIEPIKNWLFTHDEKISGAMDKFATIMTTSMKQSRKEYEDTTSELLNFYKSEADYYTQQMNFLKNKEEIRKFYRIIKDLEDVGKISDDWVDEYLKSNGYSV